MEHRCYCCCAFHSHTPIFNNEQNSYPKLNVKQTLTYTWAEQQVILSRCLLKITWNVFKFIIQLHLQTMLLVFYINFHSEKNNNPKRQLKCIIGSALHAIFTLKFPIFKSLIFYFFVFPFNLHLISGNIWIYIYIYYHLLYDHHFFTIGIVCI
jgi:hypothetical protein